MSVLAFWITVGALSAVVLLLMVLALWRVRAEDLDAAHEREMRVYRDQLEEIERDLARGVIGEGEAVRLRTEVSRRLLEADRARARHLGRGPAPKRMRAVALVVVLALLPVSAATYWWVGAPGYADLPLAERLAQAAELHANRPDQAALEARMAERRTVPSAEDDPDRAEHEALVAQLRRALEDRPMDLEGHGLLAHNEALLGNFPEAAAAQTRVIELRGAEAAADDHAALAEYLILAAGGAVSPEAEAVLEQVLRRDPQHLVALYYTGLLFAQTGRQDRTFAIWRRLHDMSPGDAPWMDELRASLPELAEIAGVRYTLPPRPAAEAERASGPGPTREDIEAASELSEEERLEMVEGMVARLMNRLATEGGTPDDWARLIAALGVMGETERASDIWEEAQVVFGAAPDALAEVRAAAEEAGVLRDAPPAP